MINSSNNQNMKILNKTRKYKCIRDAYSWIGSLALIGSVWGVAAAEPPSYDALVMEDNPVGYWRLNEADGETAVDSAGDNDGAITLTLFGSQGAILGSDDTAMGFDGTSKIDIPNTPELNGEQFSFEVWAKVTGGEGTFRSPLTSRDDFPQRGYILYAGSNNRWQFWNGATGGGWQAIQGPEITLFEWYHLVGTYDGSVKRFYVNGIEVGSAEVGVELNTEMPLRIGAGATETDGNFFFQGDIDEVAVYDSVLSAERILEHFAVGAVPSGTPPSMSIQPVSQTFVIGAMDQTVTFSAAGIGSLPLSYQWMLDGEPVEGATEATLAIENVESADQGDYTVEISNEFGNVTSDPATLTMVAPPVAPADQTVLFGSEATLSVATPDNPGLAFQWMQDGVVITDATSSVLLIESALTSDAGSYTVDISYDGDTLTSEAGVLNVVAPAIDPVGQTVFVGNPATFALEPIDGMSVQWLKDGSEIADATDWTLSFESVETTDTGDYSAVITAGAESIETDIASLIVPEVPTQPYADIVTGDGPVAYFRLGESAGVFAAADSIGGKFGNVVNTMEFGQPGAILGDADTAAGFTGEGFIDVDFAADLNSTVFTVELWANVAGGAGSFRSPLTSRDYFPATEIFSSGYMFYAASNDTWQFWTGNNSDLWNVSGGPEVVIGEWVHLVGSFDGTVQRFYVNGALVSEFEAELLANTFSPFRIGGGASEDENGSFFFNGSIDEIAYYDKVLTPLEVANHYAAAFPPAVAPSISQDPMSQIALKGQDITFRVAASSGSPVTYQWRFNGDDLEGETDAMLVLLNVQEADAGEYTVEVTNNSGSVVSAPATLELLLPSGLSYEEEVLGDSPVAFYPLDETEGVEAVDVVGGLNGEYLNDVILGQPGAVLSESGTSAGFVQGQSTKVDIPWSVDLNPTTFTAEVWAMVTGGTSYRSPLTSRADLPQRGYIFYATPGNVWEFWTGQGDQSGWHVLGGPGVTSGEWVHLAGTFDGFTKRFYVNGQEVASEENVFFGPNDEHPLRIGGGATESPGSFFFEGQVDNVAIYDTALTAERILAHYVTGATPADRILLEFEFSAGELTLTWDGSATLQSSSEPGAGFEDVSDAASPYLVQPGEGSDQMYFKLRQ